MVIVVIAVYTVSSCGLVSGIVWWGYKHPKQAQALYDWFHPLQAQWRKERYKK